MKRLRVHIVEDTSIRGPADKNIFLTSTEPDQSAEYVVLAEIVLECEDWIDMEWVKKVLDVH